MSEPVQAVDPRAPSAAGAAAEAVSSRTSAAAQSALRGVRGGLREAGKRFEEERADWERVAERSAMPDVLTEDPLADLAIRLDREADFWRAFALRALAPGAARALAVTAALLGLVGVAVLAVLAGAEAAAALGAMVALAVLTSAWLARAATRIANEALARADDAERRLHRVAMLLALRKSDDPAYREALARAARG